MKWCFVFLVLFCDISRIFFKDGNFVLRPFTYDINELTIQAKTPRSKIIRGTFSLSDVLFYIQERQSYISSDHFLGHIGMRAQTNHRVDRNKFSYSVESPAIICVFRWELIRTKTYGNIIGEVWIHIQTPFHALQSKYMWSNKKYVYTHSTLQTRHNFNEHDGKRNSVCKTKPLHF